MTRVLVLACLILLSLLVVAACIGVLVLVALSPYSMVEIEPGSEYVHGTGKDALVHMLPGDVHFTRPVHALKPDTVQEMIDLMRFTVTTLNNLELQSWWASGPTLDGCLKVEGQLPYHSSMELGISHSGLKTVLDNRAVIEADGDHLLVKSKLGYRITMNNFARFPFVEFVPMQSKGDSLLPCMPLSELGECTFGCAHSNSERIIPRDVVYPVRSGEIEFEGMNINSPNQPGRLLELLTRKKPVVQHDVERDNSDDDDDSSVFSVVDADEAKTKKPKEKDEEEKEEGEEEVPPPPGGVGWVQVDAAIQINNAKTRSILSRFF